MKTRCIIEVVFEEDVSRRAMAKLERLYPSGKNPSGSLVPFSLDLPTDHPVIPEVIAVLKDCGLPTSPRRSLIPIFGGIAIRYIREFDDIDFDNAPYLSVCGDNRFIFSQLLELQRTPPPWQSKTQALDTSPQANKYMIETNGFEKDRCVAARDQVVLLDEIKPKFEAQGFKGLEFRKCVPIYDPHEFCVDETFPIWEIESQTAMPALSPDCQLIDLYDPKGGALTYRDVDEGLHFPGLLRYRRDDMVALSDIDVARTREGLGWGMYDHPLIISQRFYQFCKAQKLKLDYLPVLIDDKPAFTPTCSPSGRA